MGSEMCIRDSSNTERNLTICTVHTQVLNTVHCSGTLQLNQVLTLEGERNIFRGKVNVTLRCLSDNVGVRIEVLGLGLTRNIRDKNKVLIGSVESRCLKQTQTAKECTQVIDSEFALKGFLYASSGKNVLVDAQGRNFIARFDNDGLIDRTKVLKDINCLLYTSPSPRDLSTSRMPSSA